MKTIILQEIFRIFDSWSSSFDFACRRGCATCCTQGVTTTFAEGQILYDHLKNNHLVESSWTAIESESIIELGHRMTTNEYADACLTGIDTDTGSGNFMGTCPFLDIDNSNCRVYKARPFSCRCFASKTVCEPGSSADVPPYYLSAATAVSQIIEHLDQGFYWGNLLHIVKILFHTDNAVEYSMSDSELAHIKSSCLVSKPLPGFLISHDDYLYVEPLIKKIFRTKVEGKFIEDILNNR